MDGAPIAGFELSDEELFVVLRLLKARALPGFQPSWAPPDTTAPLIGDALRSAEAGARALIARGFAALLPDQSNQAPETHSRVELPAPVIALVGACAFSPYVIRVAGLTNGERREFYLGQFTQLGALHTSPSVGLHLFTPLRGTTGVVKAVTSLLGVPEGAAHGGQLGAAPLAAMRHAIAAGVGATPNPSNLGHALSSASFVNSDAQRAFEHALANATICVQLTVGVHGANSATIEESIFVVGSASNAFMLSPLLEDTTMVGIYAANAQRVAEWVEGQLPDMTT
jgi:hypothetical protein